MWKKVTCQLPLSFCDLAFTSDSKSQKGKGSEFEWKQRRANATDWSGSLLFLVDEDEVDLALAVREEGGGVVLAADEVQVHRGSVAGGGVPRGPRVRRRRVLQDLREREKKGVGSVQTLSSALLRNADASLRPPLSKIG